MFVDTNTPSSNTNQGTQKFEAPSIGLWHQKGGHAPHNPLYHHIFGKVDLSTG